MLRKNWNFLNFTLFLNSRKKTYEKPYIPFPNSLSFVYSSKFCSFIYLFCCLFYKQEFEWNVCLND